MPAERATSLGGSRRHPAASEPRLEGMALSSDGRWTSRGGDPMMASSEIRLDLITPGRPPDAAGRRSAEPRRAESLLMRLALGSPSMPEADREEVILPKSSATVGLPKLTRGAGMGRVGRRARSSSLQDSRIGCHSVSCLTERCDWPCRSRAWSTRVDHCAGQHLGQEPCTTLHDIGRVDAKAAAGSEKGMTVDTDPRVRSMHETVRNTKGGNSEQNDGVLCRCEQVAAGDTQPCLWCERGPHRT